MRYTASDEDMREYSRIIASIAQLDLERQRYGELLAKWEQEHQVPDIEPAEEDPDLEKVGLPA